MLSIIVVALERPILTERCINSIIKNTTVPHEIILVDNGSKGKEALKLINSLQGIKNIKIIRSEYNLGCAEGRNLGIKNVAREAKYIAIMTNDLIALSNWDIEALNLLENTNYIGIQPKILTVDNKIDRACLSFNMQNNFIKFKLNFAGEEDSYAASNMPRPVNSLLGTCIIVKKEIFNKVGLFDANLPSGLEDYEFSLRLASQNIPLLYLPSCKLIHDHNKGMYKSKEDFEYERIRFDPTTILNSVEYLYRKHGLYFMSMEQIRLYKFLKRWKVNELPSILRKALWWIARKVINL